MRTLILCCVILVCAGFKVSAQQLQNTPPRTVTAPVTVVAPPSPVKEVAPPLAAAEQDAPVRVVQEGPVRVVQSGPVTFTLPLGIWIAWLASIATGLGAIAVISRYAKKAATFIHEATQYRSVLMEIAKEFKSNSGSTLKDSIDRIELATEAAQTSADTAKTVADNLDKTLREHMASAKTRDEIRAALAAEQRRDDLAGRREREQQQG